jgi:hypothetical protein
MLFSVHSFHQHGPQSVVVVETLANNGDHRLGRLSAVDCLGLVHCFAHGIVSCVDQNEWL